MHDPQKSKMEDKHLMKLINRTKISNKLRYISLIIFIFLILTSLYMEAKEEDTNEIDAITSFIKKKRINVGYITFGFSHLNLGRVSNYLKDHGCQPVDNDYLTFGIGGFVISRKMVIGVEYVRTLLKDNYLSHLGPFITHAKARYTQASFGYLLKSDNGLMYYPYLGVGLGKLILRVTENNIDSFGNIFSTQRENESIKSCFLLNPGIAFDYFHKFNKKRNGKNNIVIGIRAGYIISPFKDNWRVNQIKVHDGPDSRLNGPYIRLTIGIGGWIEKIIQKAL